MVDEEAPHVLDGVELVAVAAEVVLVAGGDDVESALLHDVAEVDERIGLGRGRVEKDGGPPVLGMVLIAVEFEQQLAHGVVEERLRDIAPLLSRRGEGEVDEHHDQTQHADQRLPTRQRGHPARRPGEVEHDAETEQPSHEGNLPRARFEARAEVGRAGDAENEGGKIDERVGETEEIGHQRGNHLGFKFEFEVPSGRPRRNTPHTRNTSIKWHDGVRRPFLPPSPTIPTF